MCLGHEPVRGRNGIVLHHEHAASIASDAPTARPRLYRKPEGDYAEIAEDPDGNGAGQERERDHEEGVADASSHGHILPRSGDSPALRTSIRRGAEVVAAGGAEALLASLR